MNDKQIAQLKALSGHAVRLTQHELVEDVDGLPAGVTATTWEPAVLHVPWGSHGFPTRDEVLGPEDGAA